MSNTDRVRAVVLVVVLAAVGLLVSTAYAGVGDREATIDFSTYPTGGDVTTFDPAFYRADGILFPPQRCGTAGCDDWLVSPLIQGEPSLIGQPQYGPIEASFTRPVSTISLRVAPALQGTATYVLKAYSASNQLLAAASLTVTQDFGDPANTGFGHFNVGVANLSKPAKRFTFESVFVRASYVLIPPAIPYGVSSISYRHWGGPPA